jgi:hydroxyacylglutathione hydrolase
VFVLITGFPAGAFAANCYLVAPAPGEECVIIDPGQDAEPGIEDLLARYRLKPIAVLLTHGHIDHMWSVAPVCGARNIPAYVHPDDRDLLADPGKGLSPQARQQLLGGLTFSEPDDVKELIDGAILTLAGCSFTVSHTPGHTQGSVTYRGGAAELDALFTGDLLFAGSIGRTDLPGGDDRAMAASLYRTLTLPDQTVVLPGHGPQTTIGDERRANPFLTQLQPALKKPAQKGL